MRRFSRISLATGLAIMPLPASAIPLPVPTSFTYQGQLKHDGLPASGSYDMSFALYDAASGGVLKAGPLVFDGQGGNGPPVSVLNGLFQVGLDFGNAIDGTALWIEVQVRPSAIENYTPLEPRQPITAAPVALYALGGPGGTSPWNAAAGNIHNTNTGNVGIGTTTPAAKLHVSGDIRSDGPFGIAAYNPNNPGAVAALGWFNDVARIRIGGNGAGASGGLDIQKTGDRSLMRVYDSGDVWFRGGLDVTGESWFQGGPVGIGTTDPGANLHVWGDGVQTTVRITNGGACGTATNTALRVSDTCGAGRAASFYGVTSDEVVSIVNDGTGLAAVFGGDVYMDGNVGIETPTPAAKLQVDGGTDASPSGGGFVILGDLAGTNLALDNNEIMARTNSAASPLFLNNQGGDIVCGGPLDIGYEIVIDQSAGDRANADCPAGKKAVGGGCDCFSGQADDFDIMESRPYDSGNGWHCLCSTVETSVAYAVCVKVK